MRTVLALLVLVVEAWALTQLFGSDAPPGRKAAWSAAIVFLPIVGVLVWLRTGPRSSLRMRGTV